MSEISKELLNEFVNALQISINSEIIDVRHKPDQSLSIAFKRVPVTQITRDESLKRFVEMTGCVWEDDAALVMPKMDESHLALLKDFLILTRLKLENIKALSQMDARFSRFARNIPGLAEGGEGTACANIGQISQAIFNEMKQKSVTIRELAEKTGLSMVSLSNFKSGKDIRLSNFLKIAKALGVKLRLK